MKVKDKVYLNGVYVKAKWIGSNSFWFQAPNGEWALITITPNEDRSEDDS